jgi:hypothetical protein
MSDDLACMIYVDLSENELIDKMLCLLSSSTRTNSFYIDNNEILIIKNLSFDSVKRQ